MLDQLISENFKKRTDNALAVAGGASVPSNSEKRKAALKWWDEEKQPTPNDSRMQLVLRRILAVAVVLGLPSLAIAAIIGGAQTADRYKELVNTAPRHIATLVEVIHHLKGPNEYVVETEGNRFTLGHAEAVDGLGAEPGDPIEYVIDTVDPSWAIGVGDPEYWEPQPVLDAIFGVFLVGFSLILAVGAVGWLLPAGFERSGKRRAQKARGKHEADKPMV